MGWRRRLRKDFEQQVDCLLRRPEREPFRLPYDLDYVPPPPKPEKMRPPVGDEPLAKTVPLRLKSADDHVGKSGTNYMKLILATEDGMELVFMLVSEHAPIEYANTVLEAFRPHAANTINLRKGEMTSTDFKRWIGYGVTADLRWETWDRGASWQVRRLRPYEPPAGEE